MEKKTEVCKVKPWKLYEISMLDNERHSISATFRSDDGTDCYAVIKCSGMILGLLNSLEAIIRERAIEKLQPG